MNYVLTYSISSTLELIYFHMCQLPTPQEKETNQYNLYGVTTHVDIWFCHATIFHVVNNPSNWMNTYKNQYDGVGFVAALLNRNSHLRNKGHTEKNRLVWKSNCLNKPKHPTAINCFTFLDEEFLKVLLHNRKSRTR